MNNLHKLWHKLTAPRAAAEDEARQEYMTKVIAVIISTLMWVLMPFLSTAVAWGRGRVTPDMLAVVLVYGLSFSGGWWLAHRGHWHLSSYLLSTVAFLLAIWGTYQYGLSITNVMEYTLALLLTALLLDSRAQWASLWFSIGMVLILGGARADLHPDIDFVSQALAMSLFFTIVVLLLRFFTSQFQLALTRSRAYAIELSQQIAERVRAEEALRESEARFRTIFETAGVSIWEEDFSAIGAACADLRAQGVLDFRRYLDAHPEFVRQAAQMIKVVDVNATTVKMFGATSKVNLLASLDKLMLPETLDVLREEILAFAEGRTYFEGETVNQTLDGKRLNVLLTMRIPTAADKLNHVLVSLMDITARVRTAAARQQAEDLIRAQRDLALQLGAAVGLDNTLRLCVAAAMQHTGMDAGGIYLVDQVSGDLNIAFSKGLSPDFVAVTSHYTADAPSTRLVMAGQPIYVNYQELDVPMDDIRRGEDLHATVILPIRHEGRVIACLNLVSHSLAEIPAPARDTLETIAAQVGSFVARAQAEEDQRQALAAREKALAEVLQATHALRESEGKYRSLIEQSNDAIYLLYENHFELINPRFTELFGVTPKEACAPDFDFMSLVAPQSQDLIAERTRKLAQGQALNPRYEFTARDKEGHELEVDVAVSYIAYRDGIATQGILRDVTARKRLEKQLRQHERLAAVGQLSAGIAHDFRNLLTTIMLYAHLGLRKPALPPQAGEAFEVILSESKKAADLVQQILDLSSRSMVKLQPLDLKSSTAAVAATLRRTIPESIQITLTTSRAADYIVMGDPGRIQQVLLNLALNARDAMPQGGELRFELSRLQVGPVDEPPVVAMPPGAWVCLAVADTGSGMSTEVQAHLFEPFFTTKAVGKGTGLGLAQVYGIIRQHAGYIGVTTAVGVGTTFHIYLPAYMMAVAETAAAESAAPPRGHGETILLAEDNAALREVGREILEALGYRVLMAAHGRAALRVYAAAGEHEIDLVITDIVMPEMGGTALIQELRRTAPHLKALGITGYAGQEIVAELRAAGFWDVIHKPFDMDDLARVIRRALDGNLENENKGAE